MSETHPALPSYPSLLETSGDFPPVDWLWTSWIPRGTLTILAGAPGAGKSLVALDLARSVIHGAPFPDGTEVPSPGGNVLFVDAEGTPALMNQRARAMNIDRNRLFLMSEPKPLGIVNLATRDQRILLIDMIGTIAPALVVIDSLATASFGAETGLNRVRRLLDDFFLAASNFGIPFLLIHHLRKRSRSGWTGFDRQIRAADLRGSSRIVAAARSIIALSLTSLPSLTPGSPPSSSLALDPTGARDSQLLSLPAQDPSPNTTPSTRVGRLRRLEVIKANLCRRPPPLGLHFEGQDTDVPALRYTEWVEPPGMPAQVDLCAEWLLQYLSDEKAPVKPADAIQAAALAGFPHATLYRARRALGGRVLEIGSSSRDPRKRWALP